MISNSGHDENNRYNSGKAGDQTGGEWAIISWYSRPWNVVMRHPKKEVAEMISALSIEAAKNDNIGYDQWQRQTYWNELKKVGYLPKNIKTPCEADCSSGVLANVKATGFLLDDEKLKNVSENGYTATMKGILLQAGFKQLTEKKYLINDDFLLPGDILLYEGHHTAVNISVGKKANEEDIYKKNVKTGQKWLNSNYGNLIKECYGNLLEIDGEYGIKTRAAALSVWKDLINRKFEANLIVKNEAFREKCKEFARNAKVKYGSSGTFTYICQLILSHKKLYIGNMDGECGIMTCEAMKEYKKRVGLPAGKKAINISCGSKMWEKLFDE